MRIAVLTTGRFHVLDLARELQALGHDVRFHSWVPRGRTRRFGLPEASARSGFLWVAPFVLLGRALAGTPLAGFVEDAQRAWWDWVVSRLLEPCDAVIAMSGCFPRSTHRARLRWGAAILVERGSRHVLSQKQILDGVRALHPGAQSVGDAVVRRELRDYAEADTIVVASRHVVDSFVEQGVPATKLFRNPYGVDLSMFPPTPAPAGPPTLLMVGSWCYRKGCDLLVEAVRGLDVRVLHAGSLGDCPFPADGAFRSLGPLDQASLKDAYAQAHVMVLPSREEGLALVQAQALSCGVPVVCSDRTGGEDLRELLGGTGMVTVVRSGDVAGLRAGIEQDLAAALPRRGLRSAAGPLDGLSWGAYGRRYDAFLRRQAGEAA